jgi:hypothetical protein
MIAELGESHLSFLFYSSFVNIIKVKLKLNIIFVLLLHIENIGNLDKGYVNYI